MLAITLPGLVLIITDVFNEQNILKTDFTKPKMVKGKIKQFYSKDFLFNSPFVNYYLHFKMEILKENPIPFNVVNGHNGWYFLGNNHQNTLNDTFGNDSFSIDELVLINNNLLTINNYFKSKNIKLYVVIPPNKNTVYREYLPYKLNKSQTKLEQLQSYLQDSEISFINLAEHLIPAKTKGALYFKTDTHWNTYGAFLGYEKIMEHIQENFQIESENILNYNIEYNFEQLGDLTRMLKINTLEKSIFIKKPNDDLSEDYTKPYLHYTNPNKDFKLLMFRDSFANHLIPFFNDTFGETVYFKDYTIKPNLIEQEKPDIVIIEIVERDLKMLLNIKSLN